MEKENPIRTPRQKRSIEKKERILEAAYRLFSEKGYYHTNTPEIASEAGVSIGCLYSYFADKHMIFLEVLHRYDAYFDQKRDEFTDRMGKLAPDPEKWFRQYIEMLVKAHEESRDFQRELRVLYESDPEVAARMDQRSEQIRTISLRYIERYRELVRVDDPEAAAAVLAILIHAIVDSIALYPLSIGKGRLLDEGVRAISRYLCCPE